MAELRTREVEDLLTVFAGLTNPDDIFALLEAKLKTPHKGSM